MAAGTLDSRALPHGELSNAGPAALGIAQVYEANFRYVWRCLRSLGVRDAVLDDALQDVFMVVQRKLSDFAGPGQLRTWLYAIALRVARRYRTASRAHARSLDESEAESVPCARAGQESSVQCNERLALARLALNALDDDKREVFVLAQVEQMSAPEIASVVGVPLNTVYSRLRAARQVFAVEVSRLESGPRRLR
jgi:RNA polymerase sigma-70 factor (ECF subfamily)